MDNNNWAIIASEYGKQRREAEHSGYRATGDCTHPHEDRQKEKQLQSPLRN